MQVLLAVAAAADNDLATLRELAAEGADLSAGDYDKRTPLHLACTKGNKEIVRYLVREVKVNINVKDRFGTIPVEEARKHKHREIADLLDETRVFEAIAAAAAGDLDTLRKLRSNGVNLNLGDYDKRTPLHLAVSEGRLSVIRYLVNQCNVDLNCRDRWGSKPLDSAPKDLKEAIITIFNEKQTLSAIQAASKGDISMLKKLKSDNVDLSRGDYDGRTPLHLACAESKIEIVRYLLYECHVKTDNVDRWGMTPLRQAIQNKNKPIEKVIDEYITGGSPTTVTRSNSNMKSN